MGTNRVNEEERDDDAIVQELCNDMVDVVEKLQTNGHARARTTGMVQGQRENEMWTCYFKGRKNILQGLLAHYPPEVVEFAFPNTSVSFMILVMLCSVFKGTDKRLSTLLHDVRAWGDLH